MKKIDATLNELTNKCVSHGLLSYLYGISQEDQLLWGSFRSWTFLVKQPEAVTAESIDRHVFETFLQKRQWLPNKIAGAHLGMTQESFEEILAFLASKGLAGPHPSPQVVAEEFIRTFNEFFPELRNTIFSDHNQYCRLIHDAIKKEWKIKVADIRCETSARLKERLVAYAYEYDCFTNQPIGLKYQVWLNFKKPMNLKPDACSLLFYDKNRKLLEPYVFAGCKPEIPRALKAR